MTTADTPKSQSKRRKALTMGRERDGDGVPVALLVEARSAVALAQEEREADLPEGRSFQQLVAEQKEFLRSVPDILYTLRDSEHAP